MGLFSNIIPLRLSRQPQQTPAQALITSKKRASYAVKPPPAKQISYEINDIKMAITTATMPEKADRARLIAIYDYIMQDSHLSSQIRVATDKVISEPFALYNRSGKPDQEASKVLESSWFEELVSHIIEAEFYGFSLAELYVNSDKSIEETLILRQCVQPDLKLLLPDGTIHGRVIPYGDSLDELSLIQFGTPLDLGVLQKAAYNVLWKFYARSDWSRASEKFGMPVLWIEADTNQDAELDRLEQKAAGFGSDGYIVTQAGDKVNIVERTGQDIHKIYLENIRYCDEQISKLINGQTGTSDTKAWTGSSEVQERLLEDINYARMRRVKYAVNNQVLPYLIRKGLTLLSGLEFDYRTIKEPKTAKPAPEVKDTPEPKKKSLSREADDELSILYFSEHGENCDCHDVPPPVLRLSLNRKTDINNAISVVIEQRKPWAHPGLFNLYFNDYVKAINQVFPSGVNDDLARRFKLNMAEFSAHKIYKMSGELRANPTKRLAIAKKYERFHQAEITTITARARSARQWERFEEERGLYPNLTWIRTRSANPRELHLSYVGLTLPMDHEFWKNNQPGNLWNCKCDWKTTDEPAGADPDKIVPPAKGLEGNPYFDGELITNRHPYFRDTPEWVSRNAMLLAPDDVCFREIIFDGQAFLEHELVASSQEAQENRLMASLLIKAGHKQIRLLPTIYKDEIALRERYYGKAFKELTKCPDAKIGNSIVEFKKSNGAARSIMECIADSALKSEIVVIRLLNYVNRVRLENIVNGRMLKYNLKKVIVITHENDILTF